jgi:deoxycytidine triphosphate deaminase
MAEQISLSTSLEVATEKFKQFGSKDPYPEIAPSLLNSADIYDYVAKTGMIFPFDESCLKPASYGVKMHGEYIYWESLEKPALEGRLEDITDKDIDGDFVFTLKKDSIAFVGLEPEFKFPDYIAARFNLKIKHIYQGLLLGTGPLVDPGFQGKIYIPLHNLTNNDYKIKINKPLIWMEFTKLSSNIRWEDTYNKVEERIGNYVPFDIEKLKIKRNLKAYLADAHNGAILSTMEGLQYQITKNLKDTEKLNTDASKATTSFNRAILVSMISVGIALLATIFQTYSIHSKTIDYLRESDKRQIEENRIITNQQNTIQELRNNVNELKKQLVEKKLIK